ncbi:MAG: hypothetical protein DWC07_00180 [Candidatus Poseidoniales archaeon]|nr:MAG: hypothetical protein DWC07_00180 [Candidatus Poseidoniales archaeon]
MSEKVRIFFTVGYLGDAFHGSQIQPDVVTVQGELIRAFASLKWIDKKPGEHPLVLSSRTDAGVHVRINGGIVDLDRSLWEALTPRKMIRAVDDRLDPNIALLTVREVPADHNPRLALHRTYRYRLEGMEFWVEPSHDDFSMWLDLFVGTYNATNFAKLEEGKNPMRTVLSVTPWMDGTRLMGFEIVGEAFLWNQVRRVANALFRIALGELTVQQVKEAIERPDLPVDFGVAPAQWLTLWGVAWEDEPLPPDQTTPLLTAPPSGRIAERTKKGRWQRAAQHEMKGLLYNEWASLGELPLVYRKDSQ